MECNEFEKKNIEKAEFYKANEIKAHVLTVPKGQFKNGLFVSNLEQDQFFWFIEIGKDGKQLTGIPFRLFLAEIYNIEDYKEVEE